MRILADFGALGVVAKGNEEKLPGMVADREKGEVFGAGEINGVWLV